MHAAKKFEVGISVVINDKIWQIFDYRTKFGWVTGYTLKRLNSLKMHFFLNKAKSGCLEKGYLLLIF